jgi:hypothetical protein
MMYLSSLIPHSELISDIYFCRSKTIGIVIHLVPLLRMHGASLPLCNFGGVMVDTGVTLSFVTGSCKHSNEPPGSETGGEFLD